MLAIVFIGFLLFFLTMAAGVLMGRQPLAGSCGGLAQAGLDGDCKICGKKPGTCKPEALEQRQHKTSLVRSVSAMGNESKENLVFIDAMAQNPKTSQSRPRFNDPLDF